LEAIVKAFGDVLTSTGELDRAKVASIVFKSSDKMKKLESILHPEIQKEYRRRASESGEKIIFLVIPLLFEKEIEDTVNEIWLCYAPLETRLERVKKRDRTSMNDILARVDMQIPDELKLEKVDLVIDTSGSLDEIRGQVSGAYEILKSGMSE
jgi:dephospho-CoA kinase